jgi:hypothetical protein
MCCPAEVASLHARLAPHEELRWKNYPHLFVLGRKEQTWNLDFGCSSVPAAVTRPGAARIFRADFR